VKTDLTKELMEPAEQLAGEQGLEVVDLELGRQGSQLLVRVFVDRIDSSQGGVTVEQCGDYNLALSRWLDEQPELIPGSFLLEVSSPGVNRRIRKLKDFRRFVGKTVSVTAREYIEGRKKFKGELTAADDDGVAVNVEGTEYRIPHGLIHRANLEYKDW